MAIPVIKKLDLSGLPYINSKIKAIRQNLVSDPEARGILLNALYNQVYGITQESSDYIAALSRTENKISLNILLASLDHFFRLEQEVLSERFKLDIQGANDFKNKVIRTGTKFKLFAKELLLATNYDSRDNVIKDGRDSFMQSPTKLATDLREVTDRNWHELKQSLELITS